MGAWAIIVIVAQQEMFLAERTRTETNTGEGETEMVSGCFAKRTPAPTAGAVLADGGVADCKSFHPFTPRLAQCS